MPRKDPEKRKAYQKEYGQAWYARNKEKKILDQECRRAEARKKFLLYRATQKCNRCGYSDFRALHFHHLGDKHMSVSQMVKDGYAWKRILTEIEKCEVLCANCHAIEHYYPV